MSVCKMVCLIAFAVLAAPTFAQPGDKDQIDVKARVKGTTQWVDVIDYSPAASDSPVDVEVGVFFYRSVGVGFSTCVFSVVTSAWLPGDVATLLDRADSAKHPDGRHGNFNFGGQAQAAYTTGIDAGRLRLAATGNAGDAIGGGISVKQNTPLALGTAFDKSDGVLGFKYEVRLVNPTPGHVTRRTLVCDVPKSRINSFSVYEEGGRQYFVPIGTDLLPTDIVTINIQWPRCSLACPADFDCNGSAGPVDFDEFVAAFVAGELDADVDGNGFANGEDFDAYVLSFEAGC